MWKCLHFRGIISFPNLQSMVVVRKKQVSQLIFILQLHNSDVWNQKNKTGLYRKQRKVSKIIFFSVERDNFS